jgi:hypothetical protein
MQQTDKTSTRKKFLLWGAAVLSSMTALKFFSGFKKPDRLGSLEKKETVKMLTQDGTLVEVDAEKLYCGKRKKITDEQLKNWVNKK